MKLNLSIEFESWEEYAQFSAVMQKHLGKQVSITTTQPQKAKALSKAKTALVQHVKNTATPKALVIHQIQGYTPSKALENRVQEMIAKKKSFTVADIAPGAKTNSNYKAKVNKWLQSHPELSCNRQKTEGKGKGKITYTPLKNGKAVLPPAEKPKKTDWPIKGASYRPSRPPMIEEDEDALEAELIASSGPSENQIAS